MKRVWWFGVGGLMLLTSLLIGCACQSGNCPLAAPGYSSPSNGYAAPGAYGPMPGGSHPSSMPQGTPNSIPGGSGLR